MFDVLFETVKHRFTRLLTNIGEGLMFNSDFDMKLKRAHENRCHL